MMILTGCISFLCGVAAGFSFMFWVAKEMVLKVRSQEEDRHQALIHQMDDAVDHWMGVADRFQKAILEGKLTGRSIRDQLAIYKTVLEAHEDDEDDTEVLV